MSPQPKGYGQSSFTYEIQIQTSRDNTKEVDVDSLVHLRILSSAVLPYNFFILGLYIDTGKAILDSLYGQDPIKLKILLYPNPASTVEELNFELVYLNSKFLLPITSMISKQTQEDRAAVFIPTVPKDSFKIMTTTVNKIFMTKKVKEIAESLISECGGTPQIDTESPNSTQLSQVIIPPTTLYKSLRYLDNTFSFFDGIPVIGCTYDKNVYIKNLTKRINKTQKFTVYHLADDMEKARLDEIHGKCIDEEHFLTYLPVSTTYDANAKFVDISKTITHIVKPRDQLFYHINQDLETVCKTYGIISGDEQVFINDGVKHRERFYIDHTGYDTDEYFANSMISKPLANLSTLTLKFERNMFIDTFMKNIGEPVKFDPQTTVYSSLAGMYIIHSTEILFEKAKDWQNQITLKLMRTNKIKS